MLSQVEVDARGQLRVGRDAGTEAFGGQAACHAKRYAEWMSFADSQRRSDETLQFME